MSTFAGIAAFDGALDGVTFEEHAGEALTSRGVGRVLTRRNATAAFVQATAACSTHVDGTDGPPDPRREGGLLYAAEARLENRAELAAALGIPSRELDETPDPTLLLGMYRRWGDAGLARCLGAFAFALWDADSRRLTLARDCLGRRALYYYRGRGTAVFSTSLGALLALPQVPREIDEVMVANYLALNMGERHRTFYRDIARVPSRTILTIDGTGAHHRAYWSPDLDAPPPFRHDEEYVERARELFDQAVATATADTPDVAISVSGGLDSSAIAATAARLGRARSITCYTLVAPPDTGIDVGAARYLDERSKVEALGRMHPELELHSFTDETVHAVELDATRFFALANMPIRGPANLGAFIRIHDAVAAAGHSTVLFGHAGNVGLTWGGPLSLVDLLRRRHWTTLTREMSALARHDHRGLVRTIAGDIVMPGAPPWLARSIQRLQGHDPCDVSRFSPINPALITELDLTRQWRREGFNAWGRFQLRGEPARYRAHYLFDHNQVGRDFLADTEVVYGHETRDPHADRRLLEFLLQVPEAMYRRNGVPRSFARTVLADRLPREILDERRRGYQGASWFSRLDARRDDIAREVERLDASPLARRLIDVPRLKGLMTRWPGDANEAEARAAEYRLLLSRGIHVGQFIRWVEGGNA